LKLKYHPRKLNKLEDEAILTDRIVEVVEQVVEQ
jgi:hypothetical protein